MSERVQLYLIRHGETEWSRTRRHTSRTDLPLTARGGDAARALGETLRPIAFDRVFCSPRLRARQTAERVETGVAIEIEPALSEWEYGDYEGRRTVEIQEARPDWSLFVDGCPGGESPADVGGRADRLLATLRAQEGRIALFSHGHFLRVLAVRWIGLPVEYAGNFSLGTASLGVLGHEHDRPAIVLWNQRAEIPG